LAFSIILSCATVVRFIVVDRADGRALRRTGLSRLEWPSNT
jgi:hypothetical protein